MGLINLRNSDFNVDETAVACDEEEEDIDANTFDQVQVGDGLDNHEVSIS